MKELRSLREGWADIKREEAKLRPILTIEESVSQFLALYQTFDLEETEAIFGPERRAHLRALQQRLKRIAEWEQAYGRKFGSPEKVVVKKRKSDKIDE